MRYFAHQDYTYTNLSHTYTNLSLTESRRLMVCVAGLFHVVLLEVTRAELRRGVEPPGGVRTLSFELLLFTKLILSSRVLVFAHPVYLFNNVVRDWLQLCFATCCSDAGWYVGSGVVARLGCRDFHGEGWWLFSKVAAVCLLRRDKVLFFKCSTVSSKLRKPCTNVYAPEPVDLMSQSPSSNLKLRGGKGTYGQWPVMGPLLGQYLCKISVSAYQSFSFHIVLFSRLALRLRRRACLLVLTLPSDPF